MNEYPPEYWQTQIDEIMDGFDFGKVHRCMTALDWHWSRCEGVPEQADLRKCARGVLKNLVKSGQPVATGGFVAEIDRETGWLQLSFVVEQKTLPYDY